MATEVTPENASAVLYSGTRIVKCHAVWCNPCKKMAPRFDALVKEYAEDAERKNIKFLTLDVDENAALMEEFEIVSVPTLLLVTEGKLKLKFDTLTDVQLYLDKAVEKGTQ